MRNEENKIHLVINEHAVRQEVNPMRALVERGRQISRSMQPSQESHDLMQIHLDAAESLIHQWDDANADGKIPSTYLMSGLFRHAPEVRYRLEGMLDMHDAALGRTLAILSK